MRTILTILFFASIQFVSYSQAIYTSRKGPKFFPGHYDIMITVDSTNVRYELFNHWYSRSYVELRQILIPVSRVGDPFHKNDSISLKILNKKVKLVDKAFKLNKKIRHRKLCASPDVMRKISFAYKVSSKHNLGHLGLFKWVDLELSEEAFKVQILSNLNKILNNTR